MRSPAPEQAVATVKPPRVLACVLCQQRKVRCDRKFPCANCVRACVQCVPAATLPPRQRRRRFPERELLERLRYYEGLLRQNNVKFEPLHAEHAEHASPSEDGRGSDTLDDVYSVSGTDHPSGEKTAGKYKRVSLWHAMSQRDDDDDQDDSDLDEDDSGLLHDTDVVREGEIKKAWVRMYGGESNDRLLLFGSPNPNVDLSALHPEQIQIFRLWQIYLENVNPLLKVTHTPTLQGRIIDAASNVANISPTLEALIFSIYCVSVASLAEDECRTLFGSPKKDLLAGYQFACQQALLSCRVWQSGDGDALTALYLYLVSVRTQTDPWSLSSILAVAIRIAQRMGMHNESTYARCTPLEAEMRRRLWWSLVILDHRICEISDYKTTTLLPTWDCRIPLNVNDFEIRPEMKTSPSIHEKPSEALFAVVRSELAHFVRHSTFHLTFINPSLNTIAQPKDTKHGAVLEGSELMVLEKTIEDKYLAFCDPENPLHFMTIWTTRGYLARNRLLEHYSRHSTSSVQTDAQRNAALSYALGMLECDTKLRTSPLIKGYLWLVDFYVPTLAYFHVSQELRKRPAEDYAQKAWQVLNDNYEAGIMNAIKDGGSLFIIFSRLILQAWEACEAVFRQDKPPEPPRIVSDMRSKVTQMTSNFPQNSNTQQPGSAVGASVDEFPTPMPMYFGGHGLSQGIGGQAAMGSGPWDCSGIPGQATVDTDMDQFDWTTIAWNSMHGRLW